MGLDLLSFMKKRSREEPKNTPPKPTGSPKMSCLRTGRAGLSRFLHFFTQFPCSFRNAGFFCLRTRRNSEIRFLTDKAGPQHSLRPC